MRSCGPDPCQDAINKQAAADVEKARADASRRRSEARKKPTLRLCTDACSRALSSRLRSIRRRRYVPLTLAAQAEQAASKEAQAAASGEKEKLIQEARAVTCC